MKFKVGDKVRIRPDLNYIHSSGNLVVVEDMIESRGEVDTIAVVTLDFNGRAEYRLEGNRWIWDDNMLIPESEPVKVMDRVAQRFKVGDKVRIKSGLIHGQTYGSLLYNDLFPQKEYTVKSCDSIDNTYLCTIPDECEFWLSDEMLEPVYADGGFCTGFRGGKIPTPSKPVSIEEQLRLPNVSIDDFSPTDWYLTLVGHQVTAKEEKKMPTKFTFYVKEGTRPDKKCNGLIPTMTTTVVDASGKKATVTCDKADYSERQGVLEAIAQMACGGNFDKEYNKAVKKSKLIELHDRTCTYCGKVFDTVEELKAHEAWHVERKKARRERYLLRKRAKEIAFEETAQKMAKEMIKK